MGIDIREGQQMECITCALCIDACDEVMEKIGRPRGLIDYLALDDRPPVAPGEHAPVRPFATVAGDGRGAETGVPLATARSRPDLTLVDAEFTALATGGAVATAPLAADTPFITPSSTDWQPTPAWRHVLRRRTILYTIAWAAFGLALLVALFIRPEIELTVSPVRNPTYVTLSDGTIRNTYDVRLRNKHGDAREFQISAAGADGLSVLLEGQEARTVTVPPDATRLQRVYVTAAPGSSAARSERTAIEIRVDEPLSGEGATRQTIFNGTGDPQ